MSNFFEFEVKSRLDWPLKQWKKEGDKANGMKRLVNSLKFWFVKLRSAMRDNNVILTLHNEEKKVYPSLQSISETLSAINNQIKIIGYAKFRNRRFLSISFSNCEEKDFMINNLLEIDGSKIAYLHWVEDVSQQLIVVDWLSNHTELDLTIQFVEQYRNIQSVERDITVLENGETCTSGKVLFKGQLKQEINVDIIPHIAMIDNLECLITVEGRSYQCFTCSRPGHKSINCTKFFCKTCKAVRDKIHICDSFNFSIALQNYDCLNGNVLQTSELESDVNLVINSAENLTKSAPVVKNLFQDNVLNLDMSLQSGSGVLVNGLSSSNNLGAYCIENNLSSLQVGIKSGNSQFSIPKTFKDQNDITLKSNKYITEESSLGESNFILIDTSSNESDVDSDCSMQIVDKAESWISDLQQNVNVSRQLLEQTLLGGGQTGSNLNRVGTGTFESDGLFNHSLSGDKAIVSKFNESKNSNYLVKKKNCKKKNNKTKTKSKTIT